MSAFDSDVSSPRRFTRREADQSERPQPRPLKPRVASAENHGCPWTKSKEPMMSAFDSDACRSGDWRPRAPVTSDSGVSRPRRIHSARPDQSERKRSESRALKQRVSRPRRIHSAVGSVRQTAGRRSARHPGWP